MAILKNLNGIAAEQISKSEKNFYKEIKNKKLSLIMLRKRIYSINSSKKKKKNSQENSLIKLNILSVIFYQILAFHTWKKLVIRENSIEEYLPSSSTSSDEVSSFNNQSLSSNRESNKYNLEFDLENNLNLNRLKKRNIGI